MVSECYVLIFNSIFKIIHFTLSTNVILLIIQIRITPAKNTSNPNLLFEFILLTLNSKYPTSKFNSAHKTLVKGDESP